MLLLLKNKLLINDEMLLLSYYICRYIDNSNKLMNEFLTTLKDCVLDCLSDSDVTGDQNIRNYYYFKQFLLFSQIWFCEDTVSVLDNNHNNNSRLLFDMINKLVDEKLVKQKKFIWENAGKEEKNDSENWVKLCNFGMTDDDTNDDRKDSAIVLRQDRIENGIFPLKSSKELYAMKCQMNMNENYDIISEYNNKLYLTQCLPFAHANNKTFHQAMQDEFGRNSPSLYFAPAPVKQYDRCLIKSNTDYGDRDYPSVACIVDFLRCSVTYSSLSEMLAGIKNFRDKIDNGEIKCLKSIVRIKNGFKNISSWKSFNDAEYCDIKFNVIYTNNDTTKQEETQIVEIQFYHGSRLCSAHSYSVFI